MACTRAHSHWLSKLQNTPALGNIAMLLYVAYVTHNTTYVPSNNQCYRLQQVLHTLSPVMKKVPSRITNDTAEKEIRSEIGRKIAEMRRKLGLSARRVAEELDVSREAITHIETGRNNLSAVSLWKLATIFHCDIKDFFPDVPDGYALTKVDTHKIEQAGGEKAARWANDLFGSKRK